ncbi:MAG: hypothetical protein WD206_05230 [Actinomycetota bacterium]
MSVPARVQSGAMRVPATRNHTAPVPATRPIRRRTPAPVVRRRVRHHVGFTVFASLMVGATVIGLVALNAMLAQTSFSIDDLRSKADGLADRHTTLTRQVADRSSPGRIADWAVRHGMRLPDDIHILHVPEGSIGRPDPAGGRTLDTAGPELEPVADGIVR